MSSPPPMIPYRSGNTLNPEARSGGQTLAAVVIFLLLCWLFYEAAWQFYRDQSNLFYWLDRSLSSLGWNKAFALKASVPTLRSASPTSPAVIAALQRGQISVEDMLLPSVAQIPFAALFGIFAAAALFDWRLPRVRWFAAMIPTAAGMWRLLELGIQSVTAPPTPVAGPGFGSPLTAQAFDITAFGLELLLVAIVLQAGTVYFMAWVGRPIASWIAGMILPRNLAENLQALWSR